MKRWLRILLLALGMVITAQAQALAGSRTCSDGPDGRGDRKQAEWTIGKERSKLCSPRSMSWCACAASAPNVCSPRPSMCPYTTMCHGPNIFLHTKRHNFATTAASSRG